MISDRDAFILRSLDAGLPLPEIAHQVVARRLASPPYTPAHAEWEAWHAYRRSAAPRIWLPFYQSAMHTLPPPLQLLAAIIMQAIRDLQRGMPCTYGLYHPDLPWTSNAHYLCSTSYHACAPGAFYFLLDLDLPLAHDFARSARRHLFEAFPFLTFALHSPATVSPSRPITEPSPPVILSLEKCHGS